MKVAIVINTSWNIYNFRMDLIHSLKENGMEVIAIAPEDEFSAKLQEVLNYYPLQMEQKGTNPLKDLLLIRRFYRLYKKLQPDCILHYTIKPNIYGTIAARLAGIPCINNVSGLGTVFLHKNLVSKIAQSLYRFAFRFPHNVFFQNRDDRNLFIDLRLIKKEKTDVLPGSGINLNKFHPQPLPQKQPFTFILVSRLLYDKGIVEYAEAAAIIKETNPETRFLLAGSLDTNSALGIPKSMLKSWQDDNLIEYLGFTTEIQKIMSECHCVVLPSYREGTPRTLLEAAALARPIVTTDVPGCREVVVDSYNGYLCKERDADDLANKMLKVLNTEYTSLTELGNNGRNLVESKFSQEFVAAKYLESLKTLQ